jgi:nicotinate-nucleotide adenylyltransferase
MLQEKDKSEDKMDVILFGGSFNPPHIGHRHVITTIRNQFPKSKLYICPNFVSPFKLNEKKFSKEEIWSLCLAEFEAFLENKVILWDEEIKKDQISFTIDTLFKLKQLEPGHLISLVIGEDNVTHFNQWKSYREILNLVYKLIIVRRETEFPKPVSIPNYIPAEKILVLNNPIMIKSSQEIRNLLENGLEINSILPKTKTLLLNMYKQ